MLVPFISPEDAPAPHHSGTSFLRRLIARVARRVSYTIPLGATQSILAVTVGQFTLASKPAREVLAVHCNRRQFGVLEIPLKFY